VQRLKILEIFWLVVTCGVNVGGSQTGVGRDGT